MIFSHGELHDTFTGRTRFRLLRMAVPGSSVFKQAALRLAEVPQQLGTLLSSIRQAFFAILFFCSASLLNVFALVFSLVTPSEWLGIQNGVVFHYVWPFLSLGFLALHSYSSIPK